MSTPEIDLHQKLMQEHDDETLQDSKNDIEVYWGIAKKEADYFNVTDLVEIYVEEFAVVDSYLQWKSEYDN